LFIDLGIANAIKILNRFSIETFELWRGSEGHSYPELTVRFHRHAHVKDFKHWRLRSRMGLMSYAREECGPCATKNRLRAIANDKTLQHHLF
jgi:hypothetical protein